METIMSIDLISKKTQTNLFTTASPNGKIAFTIYLEEGKLFYYVTCNSKQATEPSALGMKTNQVDYFDGLTFISSDTSTWKTAYTIPGRKKSVYTDHPTQGEYTVEKDGRQLKIIIRAYDDGVAFRYYLPGPGGTLIEEEYTQYHLMEQTIGWGFPWINTYEQKCISYSYEEIINLESKKPILASVSDSADSSGTYLDSTNLSMPFLTSQNDVWTLYTEASLYNANGTYAPSILKSEGNGILTFSPAPDQAKYGDGKSQQVALPFSSPWRVMIVTDNLNDLVNSTLVQNVNPESKIDDTSWIKPGRMAWSWWSDYTFEGDEHLYPNSPQRAFSLKQQKRLVDFAKAMGWEYVTVDAGWVDWTDGTIPELVEYANEKKIGIFIWVDPYTFTPYGANRMNIRLWASWGIAGIKCDMLMNDSQAGMSYMEEVADYCAELGLMVNFHNSTKPGGENRTWPNVVASEGVLGLEHHWLYWPPLPTAAHNCMLPFVRNVIGAMDYTPVGFSNNNRNTSQGHQLALSVIFECAVQHFADSIDIYDSWKGTEFIKEVHTVWDEINLLEGAVGEYVTMARRSGEDWFIGAITDAEKEATIQLSKLNLSSGTYHAFIYRDGQDHDYLEKEVMVVDQNTVLTIPMLNSGGCAILISKTTVPNMFTDTATVYEAEEAELLGNTAVVDCQNCSGGKKVSNIGKGGEIVFHVNVPKTADYEVKVYYLTPEQRSLSCSINEQEGFDLEIIYATGSWNVERAYPLILKLNEGENTIRFYHPTQAVDIDKISIYI